MAFTADEILKFTEYSKLDLKLLLKLDSDEDKEKFVNDVCAMLNIGGGQLLYGVREGRSGKPHQICPIKDIVDDDSHRSKIINLIKDKIYPTPGQVEVDYWNEGDGKLFCINIGCNARRPYQSKFNGAFYTRISSQNRVMTYDELSALAKWETGFDLMLRRFEQEVSSFERSSRTGDMALSLHIALMPFKSLNRDFRTSDRELSWLFEPSQTYACIGKHVSDGTRYAEEYFMDERLVTVFAAKISDDGLTVASHFAPLEIDNDRGRWNYEKVKKQYSEFCENLVEQMTSKNAGFPMFCSFKATSMACSEDMAQWFCNVERIDWPCIIVESLDELIHEKDVFFERIRNISRVG